MHLKGQRVQRLLPPADDSSRLPQERSLRQPPELVGQGGEALEHSSSSSCERKRSAYTGRPKEAFPVNESSLGGKKESRRKTKSLDAEKGRAYTCRPKETFRANESALGSQKESRLEISNCSRSQHRAVAGRSKSRLHDKSNCSREDSNLHGLPHTVLSRTRLPVPPREQKSGVLQCEGGSVPAS